MKKLLFLFVFIGSMTAHASTSLFNMIKVTTSCGTVVYHMPHPDDTFEDLNNDLETIEEWECGGQEQ